MLKAEIAHIISMANAPWYGWTMLVLLLCGVLAEFSQPGIVTQAPGSLFARADRTYKKSPDTFGGQLLITLFRIGTPAMALCLCLCTGGHAPFRAFWAFCGIILAMIVVKMLCNTLLNYTFMLNRLYEEAYEHYGNLTTLAAVILYPLLLILVAVDNLLVTQWAIGIVAVLFILIWAYRSARMYIVSPIAVLYLAIYIASLEIMPMATVYYLSNQLISIL